MPETRWLADVLRGTRGLPGPPGPGGSGKATKMPLAWDPFRSLPVGGGLPGPRGLRGIPGPPGPPSSGNATKMPLAWDPFRRDKEFVYVGQKNPRYMVLYASNIGSASNTVAAFAKHSTNTTNPPPLPLCGTSSYYGSGVIDPYLIMERWRLVDIKVVCAGAAVSQATVGAAPTLRLRFYQCNLTNNTTIANIDLPCISGIGSIGTLNDVSGRTALIYFSLHQFTTPVEPVPFTMLGWEFRNTSTDNNKINGIAIAESALVFKHRGT
jgi:hypothetical protein